MENRRETLGVVKICRFCLTQNRPLGSLYEKSKSKNIVTLPLKILSSVSIEVLPSDKKPTYICERCKFFMNIFYEYKHIVRQADEAILQYVQNGTPLGTVNWPNTLSRIYRNMAGSETVKTVVEGGATIQVTSHEISDSDEEDGNVYNVKIGDDEDSKTCIKVVTSKDTKPKDNTRGKGFGSITKLVRHVRSHVGDRPYPCKYCEKSFTKSHHYTRHIRIKHRDRAIGTLGPQENYRCEQCDDVFDTQDDLIYHSAIHATQNLTCPLCQEKFEDVEAVTSHIKSHVNGVEFMCDYCELIFTTQDKLNSHLIAVHDDEIENDIEDESSMEMDEDEEEDNGINIKQEGDEMIIEINKPANYLVNDNKSCIEKMEINSEESENEVTYTELQTVDTLAIVNNDATNKPTPEKVLEKPVIPTSMDSVKIVNKTVDSQAANILRKAEEIKHKVPQAGHAVISPRLTLKKNKPISRVESSNSGGASDKSLRLLEKELQDLKRTNSRNTETSKISSNKVLETLKSKRPQFQTSTPKLRSAEERKFLTNKSLPVEKKQLEKRIVTKENKEPKETREVKNNGNSKEEKDSKEKEKDTNEKDIKEKEKEKNTEKDKGKEIPKIIIKNGSPNERNSTDEGLIRRSTRPSKIKDYAKMIRERTQDMSDDDETTEDDEDYCEPDRSTESRRGRRPSQPSKPVTVAKTPPASSLANPPRKRGRPRKDAKEVPPKIKKVDVEEAVEVTKAINDVQSSSTTSSEKEEIVNLLETSSVADIDQIQSMSVTPEPPNTPTTNLLVSPTGQTLKKVPIKALPPGIKVMPLPASRPKAAPELCEMQIGKKVVKVQKIVMTKAEVEAMAKKGLVEMKGGTMVLKQGIKLPTSDASNVKSTITGDGETLKRERAAPTRCELGDES
ncbi:uncharacterized protein DDB_G0284459-like isoform X2 [Pararge aegeria]|nr:uncharacterized protein DDB_G0284459-like isoform X2 [Pararge aegeria]